MAALLAELAARAVGVGVGPGSMGILALSPLLSSSVALKEARRVARRSVSSRLGSTPATRAMLSSRRLSGAAHSQSQTARRSVLASEQLAISRIKKVFSFSTDQAPRPLRSGARTGVGEEAEDDAAGLSAASALGEAVSSSGSSSSESATSMVGPDRSGCAGLVVAAGAGRGRLKAVRLTPETSGPIKGAGPVQPNK